MPFKPIRLYLSLFLIALLLTFTLVISSYAQEVRIEPRIPEIPGYVMLKCDFHMHTVFSDGTVWPTVRAKEAWRHGLDAFAITDHVEYQSQDIKPNLNRPYEIAKSSADPMNLLAHVGK